MSTDRRPHTYDELKEVMIDPSLPGVTVVMILEHAARDEELGEPERATARAWLARLVDEHGNPKDDFGRDPLEAAAEENSLGLNGSLTTLEHLDDRDVFTLVVSHRVRGTDRDRFRRQLGEHLALWADEITAQLYEAVGQSS